jgi:membrane protease subunit HflK
MVTLDPDEVAIVYRFGTIDRLLQSGLHFRLPWPIESHDIVAQTELRTLPLESQRLLTGDSSLIDLTLSVQYTVSDPIAFILGSSDPANQVAQVVQAASSRAAAATDIDTMIDNRGLLQDRIRALAQTDLDTQAAGIRIETIDVQDLVPPAAVVDAFNDVSSAKSDRETTMIAAEAYSRKTAPEARGRAEEILREAESWVANRQSKADQDVARFTLLLEQYRESPEAIRLLMNSEIQASIGERARIIHASPGTSLIIGTDPNAAE